MLSLKVAPLHSQSLCFILKQLFMYDRVVKQAQYSQLKHYTGILQAKSTLTMSLYKNVYLYRYYVCFFEFLSSLSPLFCCRFNKSMWTVVGMLVSVCPTGKSVTIFCRTDIFKFQKIVIEMDHRVRIPDMYFPTWRQYNCRLSTKTEQVAPWYFEPFFQ